MMVAICIVGFRNGNDIRRCLSALEASRHREFRVVICENGGSAAFADLRASLGDRMAGGQAIEIIQAPRNLGYAGGVNFCIAASTEADAWWILNPDTQPTPDALGQMLARLANGDCDAVGCTICTPGGVVESRGGRWRPRLARAESIGHGTPLDAPCDAAAIERDLGYLSGASMLASRRFREIAGPMREDYFLYAEEVEWCIRAVANGARLGIASAAQVMHHQGTTTGSVSNVGARSRTAVFLDERNKLLVIRDTGISRLPVAALASLILIFLRFARRAAWRQLGWALSGWRAGLGNQRGAPHWIADA